MLALTNPMTTGGQAAPTISHGELLIGYDQVWPAHDLPFGLASLRYRFDLNRSLTAGLGTFGAMTGNRGGLFVFGGELGAHAQLSTSWQLTSGLFAGGGGGQRPGVGGGLMVAPEVGVAHGTGGYRFEGHVGYADFPNGSLHGAMAGMTISIPIDLIAGDPKSVEAQPVRIAATPPDQPAWRFTDNYFGPLVQSYGQQRSQTTIGTIDSHRIGLFGVEVGHFLSERYSVYVQGAGAFSGITNGYMEILGGMGLRYPLSASERWFADAKLGAGSAGGGQRETSGGFVVKPELGLEYALTRRLAVEASGGYMESARGSFSATVLSAQVNYHFGLARPAGPMDASTSSVAGTVHAGTVRVASCFHAWQIEVSNETYLTPQRDLSSGGIRQDVNLFSFALNSFFSRHFFLTGQIVSAYAGRAGGYAAGMVGAGGDTGPLLFQRLRGTVELLAGAAGGGGIDVGGGVVAKARAGVSYELRDNLSLTISGGRIKAMRGGLNATTLGAGLTYRFALLQS
jgi:hypothetical protein